MHAVCDLTHRPVLFLVDVCFFTSIATLQDAHKRLVLKVAEWLTASLYQSSREVSDMS